MIKVSIYPTNERHRTGRFPSAPGFCSIDRTTIRDARTPVIAPAPILCALALLALSTWIGTGPVRKMIEVREARHELRRGSAGAIRGIAGWAVIAFWLMATWFAATVLGDWSASGDLSGAIDRSLLRLRVLLEIAAALGDRD